MIVLGLYFYLIGRRMYDTREVLWANFSKLSSKSRRLHNLFTLILILFFISLNTTNDVLATESQLTPTDAQKLWNKTCFTCHGDSGDIARNFLSVVDGELQGPIHKKTFRNFLTNHYLSKVKADAIYSMLLSQATSKTRFEQECGSCHKDMSELIREKLALHNGILYSKKSKTPTYGFLETHRELNKDDVRFFMKKLTFKGYEIYLPVKME